MMDFFQYCRHRWWRMGNRQLVIPGMLKLGFAPRQSWHGDQYCNIWCINECCCPVLFKCNKPVLSVICSLLVTVCIMLSTCVGGIYHVHSAVYGSMKRWQKLTEMRENLKEIEFTRKSVNMKQNRVDGISPHPQNLGNARIYANTVICRINVPAWINTPPDFLFYLAISQKLISRSQSNFQHFLLR